MIAWSDFEKVEMRVGVIRKISEFPEARNPSYKLEIDFGEELGTKKSSAQITNYEMAELEGRQVICVCNFPPKQIANSVSEVLVLGVPGKRGGVILLSPTEEVNLGDKVF